MDFLICHLHANTAAHVVGVIPINAYLYHSLHPQLGSPSCNNRITDVTDQWDFRISVLLDVETTRLVHLHNLVHICIANSG